MSCPSCGSDVPESARFCPACGHQVHLHGDQRRVVTVVFADLAHFTGLSETLDPESVKNVVDRCFAALANDITSHGGRVDKVVGDAIIALFGAPVAHEDDAERAVRAALQMQETIRGLESGLGLALELRVGINTGEVLVGAIRAGGDYTAMGDVVNVASRLQTAADPGSVVVGEQTHELTSAVVGYRDLGWQRPRGREEPVRVWEALESLLPPGHRPRRTNSPFVGREEELGLLRHTVAAAFLRRRPSLALILGEAGVGKTRLTEELSSWSSTTHGAMVLEGRCVPYGQANPWWPVAEAVRQACGIDGSDGAGVAKEKCRDTVSGLLDGGRSGEIDQIASGLMHLLGYEDALPDVDPQRAHQEARRALHLLVGGLCARQPLVVVLSEIHWADDVVLDLVGTILDRAPGMPLALIVTGRPELLERWTVPVGRHNQVLVHLDPLGPDATRALVAALLDEHLAGRPDATRADMIENLSERSGGNPFFLEELVALVSVESGGQPTLVAAGELPATLRGIVAARLDSLPAAVRSMLEDAAVIGRSGSNRALSALCRARGVENVDMLLTELSAQDLISRDGHRWEFRSDVVREVLYEILTKSERARRHWLLASWTSEAAARADREDEYLEQVAHHYASAAELVNEVGPAPGVPDDVGPVAVAALRRAASWALGRELLSSAARLLDRAEPLVPPETPATAHALRLDRAQVRIQMRELAAAAGDIQSVLDSEEAGLRPYALTLLGYLEQARGEYERSGGTLSRALAEWRDLGDREGEGYALRGAGMTSLLAGDTVRAEDQLRQALDIARDLGRRRDEAWALWTLSWVSFSAGQLEQAEQRLTQASEAFKAAGDAGGQGWVRGLLGYIRLTQGRRQEAEELALGLVDDARDRGDRWALGMMLVLIASLRLWQGQVQASLELSGEARQVFAAIKDGTGTVAALGVAARALAAAGRVGEAQRWASQVAALTGDEVSRAGPGSTGSLIAAHVALHAGDWQTALALLDSVPSSPQVDTELAVTEALARLQAGQPAAAVAKLEAVVRSRPGPGHVPNLYAVLGLAQAASGRPEEALAAAATSLGAEPPGTYRDSVLAGLARAFALHQLSRAEEAESALRQATAEIGATDDRLTWAIVRLAAGRLREAAGQAAGVEQTLAALTDLRDMDAGYSGWDNLFRACARVPAQP